MKQVGRYEIIEELGQGAMGAVYKARDPMMDRVVAVKTILASALTGPLAADYRERFFREARAAGRLAHPGIVTVYDVSEQDGTPFLVMELIEGRTLEKILGSGERFDTERVMELGQQLAEALDYAHKGGVIHRDIKPANIMVTADGRPKITDFGVAKLTAAQVTTTGQLLGTPAFMAPEQFTGAPIDGRADLFALGVMLYWLATGDRPFTGETLMAMSYKIVHTEPVPPRKINPAIPRDLENVIMKCMEKDPAERYQNGEALARDLRTMREGRALDTLNRERMEHSIDKTALTAAPQPPEADAGEDSMDSAETVAVLQPRPRAGSGSPAGIRAGATAPRGTVAAPQQTVSAPAPEAEHSKRRMLLMIAAIVIVALLVAAVLKKRAPEVPPQDQAQQQAQLTPQPGSNAANVQVLPPPVQVPAPPVGFGEPPEVRKARADAEKAVEESRKESAAVTAKRPAGLQLEFTATERAMLVLTPDAGPAASYQMQPGNSVTAKAENEMKLFVDNAGAIQWKLNGKTQLALGAARKPASLRITAAGVETLWAGNAALAKRLGKALGPLKSMEGKTAGPDSANVARGLQQELKANFVRLRIETRGIPLNVELAVSMDGQMILQRPATPAAVGEAGAQRMEEFRVIPQGRHEFQVRVGRSETRMGLTKSVTGEFAAGQMRVLLIQFAHESSGRGERIQNRLVVELR